MASVEWGKYKLCELFAKIDSAKMNYKTSELPSEPTGIFTLPCLTAGIQNQGLNNYVPRENALILKNVITISANGANTGATFYQSKEFTVLQDAYALKWVRTSSTLSDNQHLFLVSTIRKTIFGNYAWTNKAGWERIKNDYIKLPTKNGKIDFEFMESFIEELEAERIEELEAERIEELEAYLSVSGLKDTQLTADELSVVNDLISKNIEFKPFCYDVIFDKIVQGRRLKKDDQIAGDIPFVMAGVTNTGVVGYISNPVASFPKNSITIDIFGNAFYRNYDFGAGDDTGVYWSEKSDYSKEIMLFLTCSMGKSIENKFSYGKKLRSSQSFKFKMQLPVKNEQPDYELMSTLISAMQKLVIADVVKFSDEKIKATKQVVG